AQQLRDTRSRLGALDADLERLEREREATAGRIARWRAVIARRAQIEADHAEWRRLQAESEALAQRLAERQELLERRQEVERAIEQEVHRLQTQIHSLRCQIEEREVLLRDKEAAEREVATVRAKLAALDAIDAEIAALRQAQTEREAERGAIAAENRRLREDMDQIKARLDQVRSAEAICPVCRRDLGPEERARLEADYLTEGTALGNRYRANQARAKEIEAEAARDADRLGALERRRRELETMARREAALAERLDRIAKAEGEAEVLRGVLEGLEQSLASGRTVAEHRARLAEIDQALAQLPYSREEHQAIRARLAGLAGVEQERRDLDAAVAALESDERQAASLAESIAARQEERAALCQQEAALATRVADLAPIQRERDTLQAEFDAVTRRKGEAQERFGAAQQRLADCLALRDRRDELVAERARVVEEQAIYDELALAFGKRGIQAMIIENIVPELEHEANAILDKMPGNTMRVEFRTQRQAVSTDGMIETLDIIISDEAGRRPYELYSGGEAFRINFAIRVALSTLLARRAGTRLQTLVIDEGFGTQDVRGRDGLVEAINAVQDEFRMILVITHIQELKEVFPNRIDVVKTPDGSRVHLN
ncbi:MAG: SMC family ATPase, partial [Thermomicrobiaceae bacterium]|nr:SMC family ATPase [Thermomicrobiaceae bacterium]